jgi:hypothetical protein
MARAVKRPITLGLLGSKTERGMAIGSSRRNVGFQRLDQVAELADRPCGARRARMARCRRDSVKHRHAFAQRADLGIEGVNGFAHAA